MPTGAALSEAVELGGRYGSTDETAKFVNGILAAVADEVRGGARPWRPIDVVVFDMDGVIRHWSAEHLEEAETRLGLSLGAIAEAAFAQPLFRDAMIGTHTVEEWAARIGDAVAADAGPESPVDPDAVAEVWLESSWHLDREIIELLASLRAAGTRVAVFSQRRRPSSNPTWTRWNWARCSTSWPTRPGSAWPSPTPRPSGR